MKSHRLTSTVVLLTVLGFALIAKPVVAEESVQDLKKQIDELKAQVTELQKNQKSTPQDNGFPNMMGSDQWDPFADMDRMHQQMQRMFSQAFNQPTNQRQGMFSNDLFYDNSQIEETKDGYRIKLNIAGFDKDKIDIKVNQGAVSISGEYKGETKEQNKNSVMESHNYGKFLNTFPLPHDADVSKMKTEQKGDQLEIFLPKKRV